MAEETTYKELQPGLQALKKKVFSLRLVEQALKQTELDMTTMLGDELGRW